MADTPTLVEVMAAALDARAKQIRTAIPGEVITYSLTRQTVDVEPRVWFDGEQPPIIPSVPVCWPRGGNAYLAMQITAGETGLIICCDSDISEWRRTGEAGNPADQARHHLQNSVFIPGLVPTGNNLGQPMAGNVAVLSADELRLGDWAATKRVLHEDFLTDVGTFLLALNVWGQIAHANWAAAAANWTANVTPTVVTITNGIIAGTYRSPTVKVEN